MNYMIKNNNKKGSHISFIISFLLFISFLIFFIGLLNPFEKAETGKSLLLKHLEKGIIKQVSDDVLVVSATEITGGSKSCLNIDSLSSNNAKTRQENGLIKFSFSDEFSTNDFQCDLTKEYEIGLIRLQKSVFQSKVLDLNNSYGNNYDTLKENLGIPETNDFEFSFFDIYEVPIIETISKEAPPTEVLAELVPINYLDETDLKIKNGYIKVILW